MQQEFAFGGPVPERVVPLEAGGRLIAIGTCGYSYADWIGPFYPGAMKQRDMLPYYAERFSAVEIDSSYYRVPSRASFENMARRTPADFRFAVKLPGSLTHLPADAGPGLHPDAALLRENIQPLAAAQKLNALLMQFPNSFRFGKSARDHLSRLREAFPQFVLAAEFRNREWQSEDTLRLLDELDIGWTNVDEPQFSGLLRPSSDVTGPLAYVRFHGRNYQQWWRPKAGADRYLYRYEPAELAPWTERILDMAQRAPLTLAFFNNHKFGNAPGNARQLAALLRAKLVASPQALSGASHAG